MCCIDWLNRLTEYTNHHIVIYHKVVRGFLEANFLVLLTGVSHFQWT